MISRDNISSFVDYNFKPFCKVQALKRILLIWILSLPMCFLGNNSIGWILIVTSIDIAITVFFAKLIRNFSRLKTSRFLCDGITYLYISIILNLTSYRILTFNVAGLWYLAFLFVFLLCMSIIILVGLVYKYIKEGKYNSDSTGKVSAVPFFAGFSGMLFARIFLNDVETPFVAMSVCLLFLSFFTGICCLGLLKAIFVKKYDLNNIVDNVQSGDGLA